LSDHSLSNNPCLGAVALGASILERHFTDRMDRPGPDIVCSMNPAALSALVEGSDIIFKSRGGDKGPINEEKSTIAFAFASIVAIKDIQYGEKLTEANIWVKRPGNGDFSSNDYENILGRKAEKKIYKGFQLKKSDVNIN